MVLVDALFLSPLSAVRCCQTAELDFGSCYAGGLILEQRLRGKSTAKSMMAGAEAADRILRQERAALEILTFAWDGCNERAPMRCPWCHQVPYYSLEHRDLKFERHGVECRARALYR